MFAFISAASASLIATGLLIPVLRRRVIDVPNERSSHVVATPRAGGIGVLLGLVLGILVSAPGPNLMYILTFSLGAGALGLCDDLWSLPALPRLATHFALSGGVVSLVAFREHEGWWTYFVAIAMVVGLVGYLNAFNFMDGINGISALTCSITGAWYALMGHANDVAALQVGGLALLGAGLGFLPWNFPRAKIFLGDVGSYGLGLFIGGMTVTGYGHIPIAQLLAPLVIYICDTGWTLASRIRSGDHLTEAHRSHVYQRVVDAGRTHTSVSFGVAVLTSTACLSSLIGPTGLQCALVLGTGLVYLLSPRLLAKLGARSLAR